MSVIKSIKKRYNWLTKVRFDKRTGFYFYLRYGYRIYIRHPRHFLPEKDHRWTCESLYFRHYLPQDGDQVLDLGVGYGEEAVYLKKASPNVKYLGVEAQPVIYECVSNTFRGLGKEFRVSPFVISNQKCALFASQFSYASSRGTPDGYIEVPTLTWPDFIDRYKISRIDLLKMNIEGAEKMLIAGIDDFTVIKRFVISCHDFRADQGEGESYRTKKFVTSTLDGLGYKIKTFSYGINWSDDWIFASIE